jgi:hypothetical protein
MLIPPALNRCFGTVFGLNSNLTVDSPVAIVIPAAARVTAAAVIATSAAMDRLRGRSALRVMIPPPGWTGSATL